MNGEHLGEGGACRPEVVAHVSMIMNAGAGEGVGLRSGGPVGGCPVVRRGGDAPFPRGAPSIAAATAAGKDGSGTTAQCHQPLSHAPSRTPPATTGQRGTLHTEHIPLSLFTVAPGGVPADTVAARPSPRRPHPAAPPCQVGGDTVSRRVGRCCTQRNPWRGGRAAPAPLVRAATAAAARVVCAAAAAAAKSHREVRTRRPRQCSPWWAERPAPPRPHALGK